MLLNADLSRKRRRRIWRERGEVCERGAHPPDILLRLLARARVFACGRKKEAPPSKTFD